MKAFNRTVEAKPKDAWPTITFDEDISLHFNDDNIFLMHVHNAHTDGDAFVYFQKDNVLHMGDCFFKDRFPFIDLGSGGSIDGAIKAVQHALLLVDEETTIIPGHGSISNKSEYLNFLTMLETLKNNVQNEIDEGKSENEIANNSEITKKYDDLNYSWGFITSEKIRRIIYQSLIR